MDIWEFIQLPSSCIRDIILLLERKKETLRPCFVSENEKTVFYFQFLTSIYREKIFYKAQIAIENSFQEIFFTAKMNTFLLPVRRKLTAVENISPVQKSDAI